MSLLKDDELVSLATGTSPIVKDLPPPPATSGDPWYGPKSPIQASSIDLHIGMILLPGTQGNDAGSVTNPMQEFTLKFGHTVVVTTHEQLRLPNDIAAFGFPPARLSFRGLLMTNPGHVDPGYEGPMRFTVMNVGKEEITLRKGDDIVTLLFFQLTGNVRAGYAQRRGSATPVSGPTQTDVNRLSLDFLDVTSRATTAANDAVKHAEFRSKLLGIVIPALVTLIVAIVGGIIAIRQPLNQVQSDVEQVKRVLNLSGARSRDPEGVWPNATRTTRLSFPAQT